jgi:hypothetical protein
VDIRWDWLQPLITVPYVPTLGPVHPDCLTASLLADVLAVAGTGRFLTYDKHRRWTGLKDEHVLTSDITQQPGLVLIPAYSTRRQRLRVYLHSQDPAQRSRAGRPAEQAAQPRAPRRERASYLVPAAEQRPHSRHHVHPRLPARLRPGSPPGPECRPRHRPAR